MSIHAIVGKPGAGKSYEGVKRAKDAVSAGRCVITNLPLNTEHPFWKKAADDKLLVIYKSTKTRMPDDRDHFGIYEAWQPFESNEKPFHRNISKDDDDEEIIGPLVIVDETMITFQNMIRTKRKSQDWNDLTAFFAVHRHHLIDVLLMFHEHGQCDTELKGLIERWHHVTNTSEMLGVDTYQIGVSNKGFVSGNNYSSKRQGKFKKEIFELYSSYAEGAGAGKKGKKKETGLKRSRPIWLRWWSILIFICICLLPFAAIKTVRGIGGVMTVDDVGQDFGNVGTAPTPSVDFQTEPTQVTFTEQPPIDKTHTDRLGWPPEDDRMVGFDNENIYFTSGRRLNLESDIFPNQMRVAEILLCRVLLTGKDTDGNPILIEYICAKGN